MNNTMLYLSFGEMGHHALAGRSTSLSHSAMEEYGSMGKMSGREGDVSGLRGTEVSRYPRVA